MKTLADLAIPLGIILILAVFNWIGELKKSRRLILIFKPATLLVLIGWFSIVGQWEGALLWFGLGLVFSLGGDVLLMLPPRFFIFGLLSFLTAHVFYIIGLNVTPPLIQPVSYVFAAVLLVTLFFLYRHIAAGLTRNPETQKMLMPVLIYAIVISVMLLSALQTLLRPEWNCTAAILVSLGAFSFYISDSLLASDRFVRTIKYGRLAVMITYHMGQILIALGVLLNYAK
jgi:uncharacterized membrane protein YhhN